MTNAIKRSILRWIHLVFTIPVLGYVYGKPSDVQQYVGVVQLFIVPVLFFSGYFMYAGVLFAIVAVAAWIGAWQFGGFGAAVLSQVILLIGRRIWVVTARRAKERSTTTKETA